MQIQDNKHRNLRFVQVIQPNTQRVLQLKKKRQEQQRNRKQIQDKLREDKRQKQKLMQFESKKKQQQQKRRIQIRRQQQRRRLDQQKQSSKLTGKLGHMINQLKTNNSNNQFTISGLDLRPAQIKVLVNNVQGNNTLKALSMTRKNINDHQGRDIIHKLQNNNVLQRLQLQGNFLGPKTLQAVAKLLIKNKYLRSIDLQGNKLIIQHNQKKQPQKNLSGIKYLVQALSKNDSLLWLNLNNTGLDKESSKSLKQIFINNQSLIHLDIQGNPDMGMQDVIYIQQKLMRNKQKYYQQRYSQFIQRKRMKKQQDISHVILLNKQTKRLNDQAIQINIRAKKQDFQNQWDQFIKDKQYQHQKMLIKLQKQSKVKKRKKKKA